MIGVTFSALLCQKPLDRSESTSVESGAVISTVKRILTLRSLVALALMFWCAGTGCMMVSYARAEMATTESPLSLSQLADASASGSMDAHACCKARHRAGKKSASNQQSSDGSEILVLPEDSAPSSAMSCCPLTSGSIVVASYRHSNNDDDSVLSQKNSFSINSANHESKHVAVPLRLPNRVQAYLLDCAFLI